MDAGGAKLGGVNKRMRNKAVEEHNSMIRATRSKSIDREDLIIWRTRKIAGDP